MKGIYLAGGIMHLTQSQIHHWRQQVMIELQGSFRIYDPTVRKYKYDSLFGGANEIVTIDKMDINNSDIVLVNASKSSWGTAMEIMYAYMKEKIIICFTDESDMSKISPWIIYHSTKVYESLEDAMTYIDKHLK